MTDSGVKPLIERLQRHREDEPVVVSCYVRLDAELRQRRLYLSRVKARARAVAAEVEERGLDRTGAAEVRRDLARVVNWLGKSSNLAHMSAVGLFACERRGLFEAVPLPGVHRIRVGLDQGPLLQPLLAAQERLDRYLAIVLDRERARLFEVGADGAEEIEAVQTPTRRGGRFHSDRQDAPGWGERAYHNRMTSQKHRHYAEVATAAAARYDQLGLRGVAVMGPSVHPKALAAFLPDRLRNQLLGFAKLTPTTARGGEVARATRDLQLARERADEERLVLDVMDGRAGGLATNGIAKTLAALSQGQVRTLVVPVDAEATGFVCQESGRLVADRRGCRGEGAPRKVWHLIDAAIDEALRQGADVRIIDEPSLALGIRGLAATLRFRLPSRRPA